MYIDKNYSFYCTIIYLIIVSQMFLLLSQGRSIRLRNQDLNNLRKNQPNHQCLEILILKKKWTVCKINMRHLGQLLSKFWDYCINKNCKSIFMLTKYGPQINWSTFSLFYMNLSTGKSGWNEKHFFNNHIVIHSNYCQNLMSEIRL